MSSVAIWNGFGCYEQTNDGQKGITLKHGGIEFWFPFEQVTYIPDFTMREVDHRESASDGDEESILTYKTFRISGQRMAEEMLETQAPYKNSEKGIIVVPSDSTKRKNSYVTVFAGVGDGGERLTTEVQEVEVSELDKAEAARKARAYKEEILQQYFQTKRERMAGGHGQLFPTGLIKVYMKELGVKDIDDVTRQLEAVAASPGMSNEQLAILIQNILAANKPAVAPEVPKNTVPKVQTAELTKDLASLV